MNLMLGAGVTVATGLGCTRSTLMVGGGGLSAVCAKAGMAAKLKTHTAPPARTLLVKFTGHLPPPSPLSGLASS